MSEMVERVAADLWREARCPGDFASGNVNGQQRFRELARAAITAMREPTDAMVDAGDNAGYGECDVGCNSHWPAMIDAALAD